MSAVVTDSALQTSINDLVELGFTREQVLAAMRASHNNPDLAVEYLMTGIPEHPVQAEAHVGAQPSTAAPTGQAPAGDPSFNLATLQNNPMMNQIRQMVHQNPALLEPLLQNLAQTNPALAQALAANPDALMQFLGGEVEGGEEVDDEGGLIPPGAQAISVTPEEGAAIERLEALGFSRAQAVEAYLACGRNEELAANFLLEGGFDD